MKKFSLFILVLSICTFLSQPAQAALYIIDETSDTATVGNFLVFGNNQPSGTGQNYEVLKFKPQGNNTVGTAYDGSTLDQAPHKDVDAGDLWAHLDANSVTSASKLVFGFDVNQNTSYVDIDDLMIELALGSNTYTYTLGGNSVRVYDDINGNGSSTSEARFVIDLGFDFMQAYTGASTDHFKIQSTLSSANAGFEEFYLSSTLSPVHTPEPSTMVLMGAGLVGLARRRFKK